MYNSAKKQRQADPNETGLSFFNTSTSISPVKMLNLSNTSVLMRKGSNRSLEKLKIENGQKDRGQIVAKLDFTISQTRYHRRVHTQRSQYYSQQKTDISASRQNPQKKVSPFTLTKKSIQVAFKETQSKRSSQKNEQIQAYGISSAKGINNSINNHQVAIYLGQTKQLMLIEAYNGGFASSYIKTQFPLQFLRRTRFNHAKRTREDISKTINQVCRTLQKKLAEEQGKINDTSACSVVSVFIDNQMVTVANCGISRVYSYSRTNLLVRMNDSHDTDNADQINRLVGAGTRLYRTTLNVPYKKDFQMFSPVRIYPSGLTYTRSFGYPASNADLGTSIVAMPEIRYISLCDVQWLLLLSSSVNETLSTGKLEQIVKEQLNKLSMAYTMHDITEQVSKKIVLEAITQGARGSITAVVVFIGVKQYEGERAANNALAIAKKQQSSNPRPRSAKSLKYIGDRKSFFKTRNQSVILHH